MISIEFEPKKPTEKYFGELAIGTYFKYEDSLYFKLPSVIIEKNGFKVNAYSLTDGRIVIFDKTDFVTPISDDRIKIKVRME